MRKFYLLNWPIAWSIEAGAKQEGSKWAKGENMGGDSITYVLPDAGHAVDGLPPKLIVLPKCDCQTPYISFTCECIEKRLEGALVHSLQTMFSFAEDVNIKQMNKEIGSDVHIVSDVGIDEQRDPLRSIMKNTKFHTHFSRQWAGCVQYVLMLAHL